MGRPTACKQPPMRGKSMAEDRGRMPPQTTHVGITDEQNSNRDRQAEETLFDAAPDGLVVIELNSTIVAVNDKLEKLFGYSRTELLGTPIERLATEAVRESLAQQRGHAEEER